jgi:hypothetical protein
MTTMTTAEDQGLLLRKSCLAKRSSFVEESSCGPAISVSSFGKVGGSQKSGSQDECLSEGGQATCRSRERCFIQKSPLPKISGVDRSRHNQQHKERGHNDRRDEPALRYVALRLARSTCRRRRNPAFWGIGHLKFVLLLTRLHQSRFCNNREPFYGP